MKKRWIQLGIVGKPHGLNGAFFVSQRDEELPEELKVLRIGPDAEKAKTYTIKNTRWQSERPVLHCLEISSREGAEAICHQPLWADRDSMEIDEDEEYFWSDVIGKKIKDRDGVYIGSITDVVNYGASDIVTVVDAKGRIAEIPFVDAYFDMEFEHGSEEIQMTVLAEVFDDVWTEE